MPGVEVEFKLALPDEAALLRILRLLLGPRSAPPVPVKQVNHFFDTAARDLRRSEMALRLRVEDDRRWLALKGPARTGPARTGMGALHERPEDEVALEPEEAEALLAGTLSPSAIVRERLGASPLAREALALAGGRPLGHLGSFENERLRLGPLPFPGPGRSLPLVFELDRTRFPGSPVERELEVEVRSADAPLVERELRDLLRRAGVEWTPARSKAERFFRILDG